MRTKQVFVLLMAFGLAIAGAFGTTGKKESPPYVYVKSPSGACYIADGVTPGMQCSTSNNGVQCYFTYAGNTYPGYADGLCQQALKKP